MTLKAYYDNIKAKTGKTPADFKALAAKKGLLKPGVKTMEIVSWLKKDFGLGRGHAMAIVLALKQGSAPRVRADDKVSRFFGGQRAHWRRAYDTLIAKMKGFGSDVTVSPTNSYISILRHGKKFSIVQVTADRLDIGIKLKGAPSKGRFEASGSWSNMVTHRVHVDDPRQIDAEVIAWLRQAYDKAH